MDQPTPLQRQTEKQIDRIAFFSDAVFAIAMTLLALELRIPVGTATARVPHELLHLVPSYVGFLVSFVVIGLYWNSHHRLFGLIRRYDRGLIWLNLLLLFCIVVMPFPASLLGRHGSADASYVVYAAWVALTGVAATVLTRYATHDHRLVEASLEPRFLSFLVARSATTPVLFIASIPLVFVSHWLAQLVWYSSLVAPRLLRRRYGIRGGIDKPPEEVSVGTTTAAPMGSDRGARAMGRSDEAGYRLRSIGTVRRLAGGGPRSWPARLEIDDPYRAGLFELDRFSHVLVLWWAHRRDTAEDRRTLRVRPRAAPDHVTGVFATRSPARPNPIAVSVCRLLAVDEAAGTVEVAGIDADDGSRVVDLKAYFPSADRVRDATVPAWFADQPAWVRDEQDEEE